MNCARIQPSLIRPSPPRALPAPRRPLREQGSDWQTTARSTTDAGPVTAGPWATTGITLTITVAPRRATTPLTTRGPASTRMPRPTTLVTAPRSAPPRRTTAARQPRRPPAWTTRLTPRLTTTAATARSRIDDRDCCDSAGATTSADLFHTKFTIMSRRVPILRRTPLALRDNGRTHA